MNTSASNRRLRVLLTAISREVLVPQPDFQRRLVWSNKDKVEFIRTVLEGYPFPEIYIAAGKVDPKTGEGCELLVDGQQRITTLYQYFKASPDLKLPSDVPNYAELEEKKQIEFLEYEVVVRDLGNQPIEDIKEIFQRINSTSYGLNAMEIHNARYGGELKTFAEEVSQKSFFEQYKIFSTTDIKRMNDTRYCLTLIVTMLSTYFNRDKEIEAYLERYNEAFEERADYETKIDEVLMIITQLNFPSNSRCFKKADFFTLFIELYKAIYRLGKRVNIADLRNKLDDFYCRVDQAVAGTVDDAIAEKYYKSALQGSNDRSNRAVRGEIIQALI
ncbi:DUF262 domain-containing protein [Vibrio sp. ABG19]|uniref:DUF262 domain-containing protein n=1 Tax=Vibrio sp. ABG19 TaxID=2817385 RepID=UPI00249DB165|nr:DUF262 domain-containing protein [Vibrio sp. ABG19]WGY45755.1 DUF262 domain-containing protein [Vibrio sp. ABG19]